MLLEHLFYKLYHLIISKVPLYSPSHFLQVQKVSPYKVKLCLHNVAMGEVISVDKKDVSPTVSLRRLVFF